jgi:hypothetical protein
MPQKTEPQAVSKHPAISLDTWAVVIALGLALLIRVGVIPRVPW